MDSNLEFISYDSELNEISVIPQIGNIGSYSIQFTIFKNENSTLSTTINWLVIVLSSSESYETPTDLAIASLAISS
jgi:hypothetical protein